LDWVYISGFFDGEGGISVHAPKVSNVLVLTVGITQKSKEVPLKIAAFLRTQGIGSRFTLNKLGIHNLRIGRVKDIISFLSHLTLEVKARQVDASLDYLRGRITGNELLSIFKEEYLAGRRRQLPLVSREWNFGLTHEEALRIAKRVRAEASATARNSLKPSDIRLMVLKLPSIFGVKDVMLAFRVPKHRASYLVRLMRREGFVLGEVRGHSRKRTLVCRRVI